MIDVNERRTEQRLRYHWPIWFAENLNDLLFNGQLVDLSSEGAAFIYKNDEHCPYIGQNIAARFSVPCLGPEDTFDMANFSRFAQVRRVDSVNDYVKRIAVQFAQPLPFKPGEQAADNTETQQRLKAVTI